MIWYWKFEAGLSRRPVRRVRKALASLLKVGLWRHDPRVSSVDARTVMEPSHGLGRGGPSLYRSGLGSQMMVYVLDALRDMGTERVSLFADPGVVSFYQRQGWELEPQQHRCAFWYAS